jgi:hypothetical protein
MIRYFSDLNDQGDPVSCQIDTRARVSNLLRLCQINSPSYDDKTVFPDVICLPATLVAVAHDANKTPAQRCPGVSSVVAAELPHDRRPLLHRSRFTE